MPAVTISPSDTTTRTDAEWAEALSRLGPPKMSTRDLRVTYGSNLVLKGVSLDIPERRVTALIGPSGCGKSTFLRCLNRMNDLIENVKIDGSVTLEGVDIYHSNIDIIELRRRVGMVFQRSNPFPKSIFDNVAYGLRLSGRHSKQEIAERVEESLRGAALWEEVKDRQHDSALELSGGQQQRLCIARALAIRPQVVLMDEPASALDPIATQKIEELIVQLKEKYTIVIVTHNMQQALRISDATAFFYLGELEEFHLTERIFNSPSKKRTLDYVTGRFG